MDLTLLSQRRLVLVAVSVALIVLTACSRQDEASQLKEVRARLEKNEAATATIELKALLQKQPNSAEARFLLGKALLAQRGEARAAAVEFKKARELQFDPELVVPELAKAYLAGGEIGVLLEQLSEVDLKTPKAVAELQTSLALGQLAARRPAQSDRHLEAALRAEPKNVGARILKARRIAQLNKVEDGLKLIDEVLADAPTNSAALLLKGELLVVGLRDLDGGVALYRRALSADPSSVPARTMLIEAQLARGDMAAFRTEVEGLVKAWPKSVESLYYRTQLAVMDNNLSVAREGVQALLRDASQVPSVLQLAGLVELQTNDIEAAKKHLIQVIAAVPELDLARRMLAGAHIRSGEHEKALSVLAPLLAKPAPGVEALGLAAEAQLQAGNTKAAEQYFAAAARANPGDTKPQVALALAEMKSGATPAGVVQLRELAATDKTAYADLALVSALVKQKDFEAALVAVDSLIGKLPGKPLPHLLKAQLLKAQAKPAEARASLVKALEVDAKYFPAVAELASLDVAERQFERAQHRFEEALKNDSRNIAAALAIIDVRRAAGDKPQQLEQSLRELVGRYPNEMSPRIKLVEQLMRQGQPGQAVAAAKEAALAVPNEPRLVGLQATAQSANGEVRDAMASLRRLTVMQPAAAEPHVQIAELHARAKDYDAATRSLQQALELAPDSLPIQQRLLAVAVLRNQFDRAVKVAQDVQKQRPNEAVGYQMEAEVHTLRKAWEPALRASRAALERQPLTVHAVNLHSLYVNAGRQRDADAFADDWLKRSPRDTVFLFRLGTAAMARDQMAAAEAYYRRVLEIEPKNAGAMNNLAVVLLRMGKTAESLALAQRANAAQPDSAAIMDTMASILEASQQSAQALEWQRKAVAKDPQQPAYRLSLAKQLVAAGDRQAAKAELEKLAAAGGRIRQHAEVKALLKSL